MSIERVAPGAVVTVTYAMRDEQGELLEYVDLPISYVHGGRGRLFPKLEAALHGARVGDSVAVDLAPADAFGEVDPALRFTDQLDHVPPELRSVGTRFSAESAEGRRLEFVVTEIMGEQLTIDANHPFAGKTLRCTLTVVAIRAATSREAQTGEVDEPAGLQ